MKEEKAAHEKESATIKSLMKEVELLKAESAESSEKGHLRSLYPSPTQLYYSYNSAER